MATEDKARKVRAVGINHVALEVGDIDAALEFYGRFLDFELRGRTRDMAFLDLGDQFIALAVADQGHRDAKRHFGLVAQGRGRKRATARPCRRGRFRMSRQNIAPGAQRTRYSLSSAGAPSVTIFSWSTRCSMWASTDIAAAGCMAGSSSV